MRAIITSCAGATFGSDLRFSALVQQAKGVGRRAKRNTGFVPRAACACACPSAGGAYKYFERLSRLPFPTWFSGMYSCIKEQTFFFFASGNPLGALCGASCPLPFALCPLQATRLSVSVAYIRTRYSLLNCIVCVLRLDFVFSRGYLSAPQLLEPVLGPRTLLAMS